MSPVDWRMSPKRLAILSALILTAVVVFIYYSSLWTGFFADDYNFLEPAARLSLLQYLVRYFDPRAQTMWYRPLQGIQVLIEYKLFGANAVGYHVAQILVHAMNCLLLFGLVWRISNKWHLGFLSSMIYATFPVYALAVNWINITDPIMAMFYLSAVWVWWTYLCEGKRRDWVLTLFLFVIAVFFKQMALTLPAILFLMDVLLAGKWDIPYWIRRYFAFGLVVFLFFEIQYATRSTHTFAGVFGYSVGPHIASIITQYLSLLTFPWGYFPPTDTQITEGLPFVETGNLVWIIIAVALYVLFTARTRNRALMFLGIGLLISLVPVLPFPFIELRYLYLPAMISAILLALLFDHAFVALKRPRLFGALTALVLVLLIVGDNQAVANANAGIYEIARQRRVPFRDISLQHPTFPDDTHLYFIDSISPLSELAGMFTLRYGPGVTVGGNTAERVTNPRDHKNAFVYYFDETGKPREIAMEPTPVARPSPALPVNFQAPIALEQVEIARSTVKRGDVLIALLYWRASGNIDKDYTVFLHLVNENGQTLAGYDSQPRKSDVPTSKWLPYQLVVDAIVMPIPREISPANDYKLEVGLYYLPTLQRLSIVSARGQPIADTLAIEPLSIIE